MKKLLLPIAALAMILLPAAANAAPCRDLATGKFAKCGAPGSVPASQYVAKSRAKSKKMAAHAMAPNMAPNMAMPAATPVRPGMMSMFKHKEMATPAKMARCKNAKSKFVKCGTPGSKPA